VSSTTRGPHEPRADRTASRDARAFRAR